MCRALAAKKGILYIIINLNKLIIDDKEYTIKSYRVHKNYDMVTLDNFNNINEVLFLLKKKVYFNQSDLLLDENEILDEELITKNNPAITKKLIKKPTIANEKKPEYTAL